MENRARVALLFSNALDFAKAFLQVLAEDKTPVLLPNLNSGTLEKLRAEYDSVISECSTEQVPVLSSLDRSSEIIFFTSGSTGEPKKIVKTLDHLLREVEVIEKFFADHARGPVYATVSHQHIYGLLFSVLWPLFSGRELGKFLIVFPEQIKLVETEFVLVSSPSFLGRLDHNQVSAHCSLITSSGGHLLLETARRSEDCLGKIPFEIFGSTETGGVAWRQQSASNPTGSWQLVDGVRISLDINSQLIVESPFFSESEIIMGDQVVLVDESSFVLLGRADRIVKIEGKRISLAELESEIKRDGLVLDAVAIQERTYRDQIAMALVLSDEGVSELKTQGDRQLKQILRERLAKHFEAVAIPKKIRFVTSLPRNSEHKVDRTAVEEMINA